MKSIESHSRFTTGLLALLVSSLIAACGGGKDPVLGGAGMAELAPTVIATSPVAGASGVALSARTVTASFSKAMNPATLTGSSFTLACPLGAAVTGSVSYSAAGNVASFVASDDLPATTTCIATVTTAAQDTFGIPMDAAVSWSFTTGIAPDTTAPLVSSTTPVAGATGVAFNTLVTASFSEPMDPLSITNASFTLACPAGTAVTATVAYANNGRIATLTPSASLPASTVCTASVSTTARDTAGNALASPFNWNFTTGAAPDTTAPVVDSTTPVAGATGVAFNTLVTASFSEPMDPATLTNASFTLACPAGTAIAATVGYANNGNIATLTPGANLPPSTVCTARISTAARDAAGNALASPFTWSFTTGAAPDTTPPVVSSTTPVAGATGVAFNTLVTASFSEQMDPLSITSASFTLACPTGTAVTATVGYASNGRIATLTPTANLPPSTVCTARISTAARDTAGNTLASPFTWSFTTGAAPDTTPPVVSSTTPVAGATGVAFNTLVTASFSEPMDPLSITSASFTLACPTGTATAATVGYANNGSIATLTPAANLPPSTVCTARISTAARDAAGNALASPFSWSFTTGAAPDTTAPVVSSTTPIAGAVGVAFNTLVTASFSEPMDPLSITSASFTLACPAGTAVTATVAYASNGRIATLTPTANLPPSTVCAARISTAARDTAGNALASPFTWSFTTGAAPDTTPPVVSSTTPVAGATGVAFNTLVTASFSEPMDPATLTNASFTLACPAGTAVTATVAYANNGRIATLTPAANLPPSTVCAARVSTAARDAAGNALASPFTWSFTTGAAPDTTPPVVSSTTPVAGATGVAVNTLVTASFSEPMDPLSITSASFTLACPIGTAITATVGYASNGSIATLTPTASLPPTTVCAASISTAARDTAGNALASPFTWSFTTGVAPDTTPPTVLSTNPANGAVGVCINKTINASFSEPMDPLSITTASFTLTITGGASVAGVVAYDSATRIASFNPSANLIGTPSTNYTATIKGGIGGVTDLAGNPLAADRISLFTTNASTCTTAPALGAAGPFGSFGGNATLTNDGLNTVINGDIGVNAASTKITGFRDSGGNVYTVTPNNDGKVNGLVYTLTAPPGSVAGEAVTAARADALLAFNAISPGNLPGGIDVSSLAQCPSCGGAGGGADELAGRTLPPGVYLSATGTYDIGGAGRTSASLTLDAGGDANAVWVFQTAAGTGTLNVGLTGPATPAVPIQVLLINGARPKNVFWYVPAGATIGTGSNMVGTMLADASITLSTTGGSPPTAVNTTLEGRAIALTAAVTMTNTVINLPAP